MYTQTCMFVDWQQALKKRNLLSSWANTKPVRIHNSISDYSAPRRKLNQSNFPPPLPAWDGQLKLRKTKPIEKRISDAAADDEKENSPVLSVRRMVEKKVLGRMEIL